MTRTINKNPGKALSKNLQLTIDTLHKIYRGLPEEYQGHAVILRDQLINACRGVKVCAPALFKPAPTFKGVCLDLRNAVSNAELSNPSLTLGAYVARVDASFGEEDTGRY